MPGTKEEKKRFHFWRGTSGGLFVVWSTMWSLLWCPPFNGRFKPARVSLCPQSCIPCHKINTSGAELWPSTAELGNHLQSGRHRRKEEINFSTKEEFRIPACGSLGVSCFGCWEENRERMLPFSASRAWCVCASPRDRQKSSGGLWGPCLPPHYP